jgi:hypothetical protein
MPSYLPTSLSLSLSLSPSLPPSLSHPPCFVITLSLSCLGHPTTHPSSHPRSPLHPESIHHHIPLFPYLLLQFSMHGTFISGTEPTDDLTQQEVVIINSPRARIPSSLIPQPNPTPRPHTSFRPTPEVPDVPTIQEKEESI